MKKELLIEKFKHDVEKRSWIARVLIAVDQLFNVIFWNGSQDETISSHIGRRIEDGKATWFDKAICWCLTRTFPMHCKKAKGE